MSAVINATPRIPDWAGARITVRHPHPDAGERGVLGHWNPEWRMWDATLDSGAAVRLLGNGFTLGLRDGKPV